MTLHLLQNGYPKSGNQWLYEILTRTLTAANMPRRSFLEQLPIAAELKKMNLGLEGEAHKDVISIEEQGCFIQVRSVFRWPIEDLEKYINQSSHVWSHSPWAGKTSEVYRRFDKVIYILRDPRDVACSFSRFMFSEYNLSHRPHRWSDPTDWLTSNYESILMQWQNHVVPHFKHAEAMNLHVVFYENLYRDFDHEYSRLLDYLGIDINEDTKEVIKDAVSFGTMKDRYAEHLQKGGFGGWKKRLTDNQVDLCGNRIGPLLKAIGYPVTRDDEYSHYLAPPASLPQLIPDASCTPSAAQKRSRLWDTSIRQAYSSLKKRLR